MKRRALLRFETCHRKRSWFWGVIGYHCSDCRKRFVDRRRKWNEK